MKLWIATDKNGFQRAHELLPERFYLFEGWVKGGNAINIPNDEKILPAQTWGDEPQLVTFKVEG